MLGARQGILRSLAAQLWRGAEASAELAAAPGLQCSPIGGIREAVQLVSCRWFGMSSPAAQAATKEFISLNNIADNPGATHAVRRAATGEGFGWCGRQAAAADEGLGVGAQCVSGCHHRPVVSQPCC